MRSNQRKPPIIVIMDAKTLEIVHVYVGTSKAEAMRHFLQLMRQGIDTSYSDAKAELSEVLERYMMTEMVPSQVTIRRGL